MDNQRLATATLDDMVFEGRNKEYGAYMLRKLYTKHVNRAIVIAIILFVLFLSIPLIQSMFKDEDAVTAAPVVKVVDLAAPPSVEKVVPPPPPPPDAPPPPPPVRSTVKFTPPVVKKDEEVQKEEIPDVKELQKTDAGTETVKGDPTAPPTLEGIESGTGPAGPVQEVFEDKVYIAVEKMPEFPGGMAAMMKYMGEKFRIPSAAQRAGAEGNVVLSFVVGPTGEITNIEVLKGLGYGLDEEAVRVIKGMPKWSPGEQNGRKVSVKYTVPYRIVIK
ncbi:energy transducer TonB [Rufibacter latericius]|uniref:Energy transducer TonB n=2 Tax=Rufibacter latericius TaxID=2487040 RepID=A0A3M9MSX3_9BACT|nr:energy transducer TonB [Rufibacter latericius]